MFNTSKKRPAKQIYGAKSASAASSSKTNDGPSNIGAKSIIKQKKSSTPPTTLELNGIEVHFPFTPYDVQRDYMSSVLTALQNSQHALLESPTGTGKTLCLLCSALAWQRKEKGRIASLQDTPQLSQAAQQSQQMQQQFVHLDQNGNIDTAPPPRNTNKPPIIIYASRTHSQLSQVVGELRNTRYRPKHAVLGSREHMCIHPKVNPTVAKGKANSNSEDRATSSEVNNGCNKLAKERKCAYRNTLEERAGGRDGVWRPPSIEKVHAGNEYEQPVLDMEDLVSIGKEHRVCPFYHSRSLLKEAELIFVPYNYLFDRDARETTLADVDFENAILIFDEAHNLEEFASESSSFDLNSADVGGCVSEVTRALQYLEVNPDLAMGDGSMKDNMLRLKSILLKFEQYLINGITQTCNDNGTRMGSAGEASYSGEFIFDIFAQGAGIAHGNLKLFAEFVKKVSDVIMEFKGSSNSSGTPKLDHFLNCLKRAFGSISGETQTKELLSIARSKSYRVHVTKIDGNGKNGPGGFQGGRTISYWCFAPALAMRELSFLKVRSILITSGTLSPLPSFSMELGLNFPVQLENNHVIQSDQIFVRVVGKGVSGKELSSKFGRRDDPEYISELGNTLASLCKNIPGGVLVFFPSYGAMETAVQRWGGPASDRFGGRQSGGGGGRGGAFFAARRRKQASAKYVFPMVPASFRATTGDSSPWQRLLARKAIVLEPRSTSDLGDAIGEFKKFISMPKSNGAILMGVCRGKISEGIDFSDEMCRAVVVTGLPFAPYMDPKVKLKREFLDAARASSNARPSLDGGFGNGQLPMKVEARTSSKTLSGAEWYNQQAHRAVNQAIGRVIRHRNDFGAVLLLDHRFAETRNRDGLSKWLRPHLRDESFGLTNRDLIQFYKESNIKAEKAKALYAVGSKATNPPPIKQETSIDDNAISKVCAVKGDAVGKGNGYVEPKCIVKVYDANEPKAATISTKSIEEDYTNILDDGNEIPVADAKPSAAAAGLGALYNKDKSQAQPAHPVRLPVQKNISSFGNIEMKSKSNCPRIIKREPVKRQPQPAKKASNPANVSQAKVFFDQAQMALSKEDMIKVRKLLVAMKGYGDAKNGQQYLVAARALITVLVNGYVDSKRIQLINTLVALIPVRYRYTIEKLAAEMSFSKSQLQSQCEGSSLSDSELSKIKSFVVPLMFNQGASHDSSTVSDRALLQDSQPILAILVKHNVVLQHLFDLLSPSIVRKVRALALELKRAEAVDKAKKRSADFKGEKRVNPALFQREIPSIVPLKAESAEDAESQKMMSQALTQAHSVVNRQKQSRVIDFQKQNATKPKVFNPYQRSALRDSTKRNVPPSSTSNGSSNVAASKRLRHGASESRASLDSMDMVDRCLLQVNSSGFVHSQKTRINGKIKANVPKGIQCIICNMPLKEPLMAECNHSACMSCWRSWLSKSETCPMCRKPATMKDMAKLVFTKDNANAGAAPTLTQICNSDNEGDSGDELEFVK